MSQQTTSPITGRATATPRGWSEDPLTARSRQVWTAGDFLPIAQSYSDAAVAFIDRLELTVGESLLDVACGTGNLALPAARAGARVTGIDIAPNLISEAQRQAKASRCRITFDVGDAEALPYADGRFDTTVTMFGAMFCHRPERAAAELVRVTRPGGRIAMANWTPGGFVGEMLRAHTAVVPPPAGVPSPLAWGDDEQVNARLSGGARSITCMKRTLQLRFSFPPAAVTELFASHYGPTIATLRATDPAGAARLRESLTRLFTTRNIATDGSTAVASEYLDVQVGVD